MKKRYKVTQLWGDAEVLLEVNHDFLTPELATEINAFWTGADDRLADADGDPVVAAIKLAGELFLAYVYDVNEGLNLRGMQEDFDQREGWPSHGGHGIRIVSFDGRPDLHHAELELCETAEGVS